MQKERRQVANLTVIEKFYIEANEEMSAEEISGLMRSAVTVEDIQKHIDSLPERKTTAGDAMARDPKRGVTVMTQTAAEISDEAEKSNPEIQKELNKDKIYRMK